MRYILAALGAVFALLSGQQKIVPLKWCAKLLIFNDRLLLLSFWKTLKVLRPAFDLILIKFLFMAWDRAFSNRSEDRFHVLRVPLSTEGHFLALVLKVLGTDGNFFRYIWSLSGTEGHFKLLKVDFRYCSFLSGTEGRFQVVLKVAFRWYWRYSFQVLKVTFWHWRSLSGSEALFHALKVTFRYQRSFSGTEGH